MKKPEKLRLFWMLASMSGLLIIHWVSPDGLLGLIGLSDVSLAAIFGDGIRPFLILGLILLVIFWRPQIQIGLKDVAEQMGMQFQSQSSQVLTMMKNPWLALSQPDKDGERLSATDIFFQEGWPAVFNFSFSASSLWLPSNAIVSRQTVFCFKNDRHIPKFRLTKEANTDNFFSVKDVLGKLDRMREFEAQNINAGGALFDVSYHIEAESEPDISDFFAVVDSDAFNRKFPRTLVVEATEDFMIFYHLNRVLMAKNIEEEYERCQRLHTFLMGEKTH
jgi:hypothetical protein